MSDDGETIVINNKGLEDLIKVFKDDKSVVRIGVLGAKNYRPGKNNSNATIGAAHEFGSSKLPIRSFLRVPLTEHIKENLENAGAFEEDAVKDVIRNKSLIPWLEKVAVVAMAVVMKAFDTSGYGKWQPSDMTRKKTKQTLIETGQLRDSITWEVK